MKLCPACGTDLPRDSFTPDRRRGDGLCRDCKSCRADAARARRQADPRPNREAVRRYNERNPERAQERRARRDRFYSREQRSLERARKRGAVIEAIKARAIFERDGWVCGICSEAVDPLLAHPHPRSASLDHLVPLSRGGAHTYDNVRTTHLTCNLKKGARVGVPFDTEAT